MIHCSYCKSSNKKDAKFCKSCGKKLTHKKYHAHKKEHLAEHHQKKWTFKKLVKHIFKETWKSFLKSIPQSLLFFGIGLVIQIFLPIDQGLLGKYGNGLLGGFLWAIISGSFFIFLGSWKKKGFLKTIKNLVSIPKDFFQYFKETGKGGFIVIASGVGIALVTGSFVQGATSVCFALGLFATFSSSFGRGIAILIQTTWGTVTQVYAKGTVTPNINVGMAASYVVMVGSMLGFAFSAFFAGNQFARLLFGVILLVISFVYIFQKNKTPIQTVLALCIGGFAAYHIIDVLVVHAVNLDGLEDALKTQKICPRDNPNCEDPQWDYTPPPVAPDTPPSSTFDSLADLPGQTSAGGWVHRDGDYICCNLNGCIMPPGDYNPTCTSSGIFGGGQGTEGGGLISFPQSVEQVETRVVYGTPSAVGVAAGPFVSTIFSNLGSGGMMPQQGVPPEDPQLTDEEESILRKYEGIKDKVMKFDCMDYDLKRKMLRRIAQLAPRDDRDIPQGDLDRLSKLVDKYINKWNSQRKSKLDDVMSQIEGLEDEALKKKLLKGVNKYGKISEDGVPLGNIDAIAKTVNNSVKKVKFGKILDKIRDLHTGEYHTLITTVSDKANLDKNGIPQDIDLDKLNTYVDKMIAHGGEELDTYDLSVVTQQWKANVAEEVSDVPRQAGVAWEKTKELSGKAWEAIKDSRNIEAAAEAVVKTYGEVILSPVQSFKKVVGMYWNVGSAITGAIANDPMGFAKSVVGYNSWVNSQDPNKPLLKRVGYALLGTVESVTTVEGLVRVGAKAATTAKSLKIPGLSKGAGVTDDTLKAGGKASSDDIARANKRAEDFRERTDAWKAAEAQGKVKVQSFDDAVKSGDPDAIKKAVVELQGDKRAIHHINKQPDEIKLAFNKELQKIYDTTDDALRQRIAKKYGVDPDDVEIIKASNPSGKVKVGADRDVTVRIPGKKIKNGNLVEGSVDLPSSEVKKIYNEEFYRACDGKKHFPKKTPDELAKECDQTMISRLDGDAYGAGEDLGTALHHPGRDFKRPDTVGRTVAFKGHEGMHVADEAAKADGFRQITKQFGNQLTKRHEALVTQGHKVKPIPPAMQKAVNVLGLSEKGVAPVYVERMLQRMGTTPGDVATWVGDFVADMQKMRPK